VDAKGRVLSSPIISVGGLSEAMVPMEGIARFAVAAKKRGATGIIISHIIHQATQTQVSQTGW
jgi:hypothetical protein